MEKSPWEKRKIQKNIEIHVSVLKCKFAVSSMVKDMEKGRDMARKHCE